MDESQAAWDEVGSQCLSCRRLLDKAQELEAQLKVERAAQAPAFLARIRRARIVAAFTAPILLLAGAATFILPFKLSLFFGIPLLTLGASMAGYALLQTPERELRGHLGRRSPSRPPRRG